MNETTIVSAKTLLEQAMEAHGGLERWQKVNKISLNMTAGGLVFFIKGRSRYVNKPATADIYTRKQMTVFNPFGNKAELTGSYTPDHVWIENENSQVIAELREPAVYRGLMKSLLPWDHLGQLYFTGYAVNHYFNLPFSLTRDGVVLKEIDPVTINNESCPGLHVTYPDNFVTHSKNEKIYFNPKGQIVRHDYTAEPVGPFAFGSHFSMDYFAVDGFIFAKTRRVYVNILGMPLKLMAILYIDIHEGKVHFDE